MRHIVLVVVGAVVLTAAGATTVVLQRDRLHAAWAGPAVSAATADVLALELPDGWAPSPGGGACADLSSVRCAWSDEPPAEAVETVATALRETGIAVRGTTCAEGGPREEPVCRATADVRGVVLEVVANDVVAGGREPRGATAVGIAWTATGDRLWARIGEDLGWSPHRVAMTLEDGAALLPASLREGLVCTHDDVASSCILAEGPAPDLTDLTTLVAELTAADWRVRWTPVEGGDDGVIADRLLDMRTGTNLLALRLDPEGLSLIFG
ncbi:MAG: hypothetical protein H5T83_03010 [Actinotalea sp.]|nr:hypothetical protein [Actinotalea sp.]